MKPFIPKYKKYIRQIQRKEIGVEGQDKLAAASVLVVGAGGLGCPALQYLAAAGIGRIGVIDFDRVSDSNLHRQILFTEQDLGAYKAEAAAEKLNKISPDLNVAFLNEELSNANALEWFQNYDLVIDATDQIHARYLINDLCILLNKPWIYGAVNAFEGQWAGFLPEGSNYRDLFPKPPDILALPTCESDGILGPVPGVVGVMQSMLAMQYILDLEPQFGVLNTFHLLNGETYKIIIEKLNAGSPKSIEEFLKIDYRKLMLESYYP